MNPSLELAQKYFENGDYENCLQCLKELYPEDSEIPNMISAHEKGEKQFLKGLGDEKYLAFTRERLQDFILKAQPSVGSQAYKILYLGASPSKEQRLELGPEYEIIKKIIDEKKNLFQLETKFTTSKQDLLGEVNREQPDLIYLSMHGEEKALIFRGDKGQPVTMPLDDLKEMFEHLAGNAKINCIIFSACESEKQAKTISQNSNIGYCIGMKTSIPEPASHTFSKGFFQAFIHDRSNIEYAFMHGKLMIKNSDNEDMNTLANIPVLYKGGRKIINNGE